MPPEGNGGRLHLFLPAAQAAGRMAPTGNASSKATVSAEGRLNSRKLPGRGFAWAEAPSIRIRDI